MKIKILKSVKEVLLEDMKIGTTYYVENNDEIYLVLENNILYMLKKGIFCSATNPFFKGKQCEIEEISIKLL